MIKAKVFDVDGKSVKEIKLPEVFSEQVRSDLIKRASLAIQSAGYQAKGVFPLAGLQTSAVYVGRRRKYHQMINRGISRLPRIIGPKGYIGEVRRVPHSKGGHRAHPPKVEKKIEERINKKEKKKATASAIAATANLDLVAKRGHMVKNINSVPIILTDKTEEITKSKQIVDLLIKLGLKEELERTSEKKIRAGRGKMRGRKYKKKKGVLIVTGKNAALYKSARNIPGTDVCTAKELNADLLAPGGVPGRLTVYTESAINEISKRFG